MPPLSLTLRFAMTDFLLLLCLLVLARRNDILCLLILARRNLRPFGEAIYCSESDCFTPPLSLTLRFAMTDFSWLLCLLVLARRNLRPFWEAIYCSESDCFTLPLSLTLQFAMTDFSWLLCILVLARMTIELAQYIINKKGRSLSHDLKIYNLNLLKHKLQHL